MFDSYSYSSQKQSQSQSVHVEAQKSNNYDVYDLDKIKEALQERLKLMEDLEKDESRVLKKGNPTLEDFREYLESKGVEFKEVCTEVQSHNSLEAEQAKVARFISMNGFSLDHYSHTSFNLDRQTIKSWLKEVGMFSDDIRSVSLEKISKVYDFIFKKWDIEEYSTDKEDWEKSLEIAYLKFKEGGVYHRTYTFMCLGYEYLCTPETYDEIYASSVETVRTVRDVRSQEQKDDDTTCVGIIAAIIGAVVGIFFALLLL